MSTATRRRYYTSHNGVRFASIIDVLAMQLDHESRDVVRRSFPEQWVIYDGVRITVRKGNRTSYLFERFFFEGGYEKVEMQFTLRTIWYIGAAFDRWSLPGWVFRRIGNELEMEKPIRIRQWRG